MVSLPEQLDPETHMWWEQNLVLLQVGAQLQVCFNSCNALFLRVGPEYPVASADSVATSIVTPAITSYSPAGHPSPVMPTSAMSGRPRTAGLGEWPQWAEGPGLGERLGWGHRVAKQAVPLRQIG